MNVLKVLFYGSEHNSPLYEDTRLALEDIFDLDSNHLGNRFEPLAIVVDPILPGQFGHVKFQGSRWRAYSDRPIATDTTVRVIGRQRSNILLVEPVPEPSSWRS